MKKKSLVYIVLLSLIAAIWTGCSDWTDVSSKGYYKKPSDEYYAALREYKESKHQLAFGWFGNWSGEGASLGNSLIGIPDSVDIVSLWNNATNITEAQKEDLKFVQEVKGTKVLYCIICLDVGDGITPPEHNETDEARHAFWGWVEGDNDAIYAAIRKYANAICDTVFKYGYDGFDLDWEAGLPQPFPTNYELKPMDRIGTFVDELSKRLGPKSNSGKMLIIDGQPYLIPAEYGVCFDYFVHQAYSSYGDGDLESRNRTVVNHFKDVLTEEQVTNMSIFTENFESVSKAMAGGSPNYKDQYGNIMMSLEGMARWSPKSGFQKGGVGTYHMEAEYPTNPEYKNLRNAIQIMNPSPKLLVEY
ncbi:MAG: endoglycosidase [Bacteroidales bacterium]|nr:endoglycosidase [Bacteroidales bacterium]